MRARSTQRKGSHQGDKSSKDPMQEGTGTIAEKRLSTIISTAEEKELRECEVVIERGWQTFLEVGRALRRIKDGRLFRMHFHSFEQYCRNRWHFGRAHAYRLIGAAQVVEKLSPIGDSFLPMHESQIRPLLKLHPDLAVSAWQKAVEAANGKTVTAPMVRAVVLKLIGDATKSAAINSSAKASTSVDKALRTINRLEAMLQRAQLDGDVLQLVKRLRKQVQHAAKKH